MAKKEAERMNKARRGGKGRKWEGQGEGVETWCAWPPEQQAVVQGEQTVGRKRALVRWQPEERRRASRQRLMGQMERARERAAQERASAAEEGHGGDEVAAGGEWGEEGGEAANARIDDG